MAQTELDAFSNPHFALSSYGLGWHYFVWGVAHGAFDDIEAGRQEGSDWLQPALLPIVEPLRGIATRVPPVAYKSRAPNRADVLVEDRAARKVRRMLGIRLSKKRVLRA